MIVAVKQKGDTMNINQFLSFLPTLAQGLGVTIGATILGIITSVLWGCIISLLTALNYPGINIVLKVYVSVFRNSPLLVQMFFLFYGLPYAGITIPPLACGVIAITLNEGAFIAEIMRGAIKNLPKGDVEAAYSLGLKKSQVIFKIVFPIAFRSSIPLILGQTSIVLKDTSLFSMIMISDLTRAGNLYYSKYFDASAIWLVALLYISIFLCINLAGKVFERKYAVRR